MQSAVLYDVAAIAALPEGARSLLAEGGVDAALFFSARSARVFTENVTGLNLNNVIAVCISDATAAALSPLVFREIRVADKTQSGRAVGLSFLTVHGPRMRATQLGSAKRFRIGRSFFFCRDANVTWVARIRGP